MTDIAASLEEWIAQQEEAWNNSHRRTHWAACPFCGQHRQVRLDGKLRRHRDPVTKRGCEGSGHPIPKDRRIPMPATNEELEEQIRENVRATDHSTHMTIDVALDDSGLVKVNGIPMMDGPWDVPAHLGNLAAQFIIMAKGGELGPSRPGERDEE